MPILNLKNVISVIPVTNYDSAVNWYKKLIGRDADVVPTEGVSEWQLAANAWLQIGIDPDNSGKTTVVINVGDLEAQRSACEEVGISLGEVVEYTGIVKMVDATDPDGNKITFVEELANAMNE
ncbi:VOC family protein [Pelagicoccus sp. SDUM812005]|uniref:VOC family protein n=1 Tax=Pelagicoccus sp. SDUM812005 TaxID=3041257 RepID=UPI00280CE1CB|nr:VOC family protein [Pelagicoccus sp. SDUM812005]MDQ8182851.1 VOC family protein [Pelagicoccus sp. SDUM812005]